VITTAGVVVRRQERVDAGTYAALLNAQVENLRLLRDAGVTLAVGSDEPRATSNFEIAHLRSLNMFSNAELLRMWSADCAATLFPNRRLGALEAGYEASFLVLGADPLADFDATQNITLRVKKGRMLEVARPAAEEDED
jgi:imidazolonepropionase-like amidohydrolase